MDSNLYILALQRQPCLLKTNSTRVLVTWLVTLLLIICPSSYKARLNNLIGTAHICPQIISPQWSNARPNFPTKKCVGRAKFGLVSRLEGGPCCSECIWWFTRLLMDRARSGLRPEHS